MGAIFNKFKIFFNQKENRQDALYILAMVLIVGIIAVLFFWSVSIVFKAMDAAFFVSRKEISEDILKFDFDGFKKIAPRLKIDFNPVISEPAAEQAQTPIVQEPVQAEIIEEEIPVDVSLINLEILNGTAIKGLAAEWKEKFVDAGFREENIKTENADKKTYSGIIARHNSSEEILNKVMEVFSKNSGVSAKSEIDSKLGENSFIIIIGK